MNDPTERHALLERAIDYRFRNPALLETALRHSSFAHDRRLEGEVGEATLDNERLEFLGDSVLALVVAQALYAAKPAWREGELTRALHSIVEGSSLTELARRIDLGAALLLGRTEESSGGRNKPSILEDAMEALVGAMYLDGGASAVEAFVNRAFAEALAADAVRVARDPKTELQETLMAEVGAFPKYRLVSDSEVEGDDFRFEVEVLSERKVLGHGRGRTKRAAEKEAARRALGNRSESGSVEGRVDE